MNASPTDRNPHLPPTPATRFQGSKLKLLDWLWRHLEPLPFTTCLDAFGGSGCVSHFLKTHGKSVTLNDTLISSTLTGVALVENQCVRLDEADIASVIHPRPGTHYANLIERVFDGIYFTAVENVWLDVAVQNIPRLCGKFKQALAFHALFQSAISKRPYNLFHRRNLYMRLANVNRSFGNKTTWDKPFEDHFRYFVSTANAAVFEGSPCKALHGDACKTSGDFDLVYIDPPYLNARGIGVDYAGFYHFLEGMADYENWERRIDFSSRHRRLFPAGTREWNSAATIRQAFSALFRRHRNSTLAVSYRSDGIPSPDELADALRQVKPNVTVHMLDGTYTYALSTNRRSSEILLIGRD
ncbi:MAG TPA: DNA adenine methylase [Tepidisphaeraceae bacterium]|nr:DNA adenine methylase [Tepidisphaeraceae bacterium]